VINIDAASISFNMLKVLGEGVPVGPMLLGVNKPAHIMTYAASARGILNMTALACVDAQKNKGKVVKAKTKKAA